MTIKEAIVAAIAKEMRQFGVKDDILPDTVEVRVQYQHTLATLRIEGEQIAKAQKNKGSLPASK